jgi:hypothetical protein
MRPIRLLARWGWKRSKENALRQKNRLSRLLNLIGAVVPSILFVCVSIVVYEAGFKPFWSNNSEINSWLHSLFIVIAILIGVRLILELFIYKKKWVRLLGLAVWMYILVLTFFIMPLKNAITHPETNMYLLYKLIIYAGVVLGFISEISHFLQFIYSKAVSPGVVFIGSFSLLIFIGAFLLKLP